MKFDSSPVLISLASWEPRFHLGTLKDLEISQAKFWIFLYFEEFEELSATNIQKCKSYAESHNIELRPVKLRYSDAGMTWREIDKVLKAELGTKEVLLDYSTMTREVIWMLCAQLEKREAKTTLVYWRPAKTPPWTSRNAIRPRLVPGRAGISIYGRPTLLGIAPGFDASRVDQLLCYFEPELTVLFLQSGDQFDNRQRNIEKYNEFLERRNHIKIVEFDAYTEDGGLSKLEEQIGPYMGSHNIIMGCHGPKPSAIAMHRLQHTYPEIGLVYTPALLFNENYSEGIGQSHETIL